MPWDAGRFWADTARAEGYAKRSFLCKAEEVILERFRDDWPRWSMLDLGVGGGRTTERFAPAVGRYVGSDFAPAMVEACRRRFPQYEFRVDDVRNMAQIGDASFDFVAFSYNGLSELAHEDMPAALAEVRRVLKPGGRFFFSQHNIHWASNIFAVRWSRNPRRLLQSIYRAWKFRRVNEGWRGATERPYASLRDYPHDFTKVTYWIAPSEQVRQLEVAGFRDVEVITNSTGRRTSGARDEVATEPFLHYLARG